MGKIGEKTTCRLLYCERCGYTCVKDKEQKKGKCIYCKIKLKTWDHDEIVSLKEYLAGGSESFLKEHGYNYEVPGMGWVDYTVDLTKKMVDEYISKSPAFDQNAFNECLEGFYKSKERFKAEWPDQKAWERELKRRIEEKVNRDFDKKLEAERAAKEACKPKCPYCKSTKVKKIGVSGRLFSTAMFGMASGKIGKQWHCNNCKSDF